MKKIGIILFIGGAVFFAAFNINLDMGSNEKTLSLLSLANIEALAQESLVANTRSCYKTISMDGPGNPTHQTFCGPCDARLARTWQNSGGCNHNFPF